jgi:hypothetical protein
MRITISLPPTHARKSPWTGDTIRDGGVGVSGTESTFVLFAEHWARRGHDVRVVGPDCASGTARGVQYVSGGESPDDFGDPEVLLMPSWDESCTRHAFPNLRTVLINFACASASMGHVVAFPGATKIGLFPSDWTRRTVHAQAPWMTEAMAASHVIPNPLMTDTFVVAEDAASKIPKSVVWHTSWERGGDVAERAFQKAFGDDGGQFTVMDYFTPSGKGSADRATVYRHLAEAEYFVYPLVLPSGQVTKDTFACCVAEALAHGVIVITWRVAAMPELYGDDTVQWIPTPDRAAFTDATDVVYDDYFASERAVADIAAIIARLEADPAEKEAIRERGRRLAATFGAATVCPLLDRVAPGL